MTILLNETQETIEAVNAKHEFILIGVWLGVALVGYLLGIFLYKKTSFFKGIKTWMVIALPFLILAIIAIPMLIASVHYLTITYSATIPAVFLLGIAMSVIYDRFGEWQERKKVAHEQVNALKKEKKNNKENKKQ
ncbi:hypothetical protein [Mycoplasmopsis columboralis]|uniref:Uncharacterized protein n=1 Tax=Mycoplasmopsis columboralis TaxID=171282 RepID=A0A449B5W5_9BACT|nr:hypothetical protein [Mycoplasmopsis columboralis]VEU75976.1 Uncharacterised protein [Mycoplasmopsis columboralis]